MAAMSIEAEFLKRVKKIGLKNHVFHNSLFYFYPNSKLLKLLGEFFTVNEIDGRSTVALRFSPVKLQSLSKHPTCIT